VKITKIFANLGWSIIWVFLALIVGYFILNFVAARGIPGLSTGATWVEQHSQPGY